MLRCYAAMVATDSLHHRTQAYSYRDLVVQLDVQQDSWCNQALLSGRCNSTCMQHARGVSKGVTVGYELACQGALFRLL